jgi:gliding motility-associated-like protein
MQKVYFILAILLTSFSLQRGVAQPTLIRQVLCGWGTNHVPATPDGSVNISSTFGQCPGCTVIKSNSGDLTLRQGFQQPDIGRNLDTFPCKFSVAFEPVVEKANCGTYYRFDYTGDSPTGITYAWNFGEESIPQTSTQKNPENVTYKSIGYKTVTLVVTGPDKCTRTIKRNINVTELGFAALADIINTCGGTNGAITLSPSGGTAPYTYKWDNGKTTPNIAALGKGGYTYTITDSKGCVFSTTENVLGSDTPITLNPTIVNESDKDKADGSITLAVTGSSGSGNLKFTWKNDVGTGPLATKLTAGKYSVTVSDAVYGCEVKASYSIFNLNNPDDLDSLKNAIPNTFSPNSDGVNDDWSSYIFEQFPNLEVQIFNRWGSPVYTKKGFGSGSFDGHNSAGEALPDGAYYYIMNLNDDKKHKFGGAITIVR